MTRVPGPNDHRSSVPCEISDGGVEDAPKTSGEAADPSVQPVALRVRSPEKEVREVQLTEWPVTVGRSAQDHVPDVPLGPDPQRWVGRMHCTLDFANGMWSVTDNASVNGTLLRHGDTTEHLTTRKRIQHRDTILILGDMSPDGEPLYWELTFLDPHSTQAAPFGPPSDVLHTGPCLRYDWVEAKAYRVEGGVETPITGLRPQGHQLLRYMVGRSTAAAVACEHEELITALWGAREEWPPPPRLQPRRSRGRCPGRTPLHRNRTVQTPRPRDGHRHRLQAQRAAGARMIRCATRTGAGRLHGENQDRMAADPEHGVFVVADGIGGLADAARTAQFVVDEFPRLVRESIPSLRSPTLAGVVRTATMTLNERIRQEASAGPDNTGAATALLVVRDGLAMTVHLGDSRVYRVRHNALYRLTDDHTSDGQLTRYFGMPGEVLPDVAVHHLVDGDRMLLCTDGLTKNVDDPVLGTVLNDQANPGDRDGPGDQDSPDEVCDRLVAAALDCGAVDDVSVIAVDYSTGGGDNGAPGQR